MPRSASATNVTLPPGTYVAVLAMELRGTTTKTWVIRNSGANMIQDGTVEVTMSSLNAADADWMPHPDAPANFTNIAPGAWVSFTGRDYAFAYYRLKLRSTAGSTVDCWVEAL